MGFVFAVPCFYFFNWTKFQRQANANQRDNEIPDEKSTWLESGALVVSFLALDHLVTEVAP